MPTAVVDGMDTLEDTMLVVGKGVTIWGEEVRRNTVAAGVAIELTLAEFRDI